jgi:hypothetical protein
MTIYVEDIPTERLVSDLQNLMEIGIHPDTYCAYQVELGYRPVREKIDVGYYALQERYDRGEFPQWAGPR